MRRLALACFLLTAPSGALAQTGVVRANGVPIPGATVKATCGSVTLSTLTDDQGRFKLTGIPDGPCSLQVQMFHFNTAEKQLKVAGPFNLDWDLTLHQAASAPKPRSGGESVTSRAGPAGRATPPARQTGRNSQVLQANSQVLELNQIEPTLNNTTDASTPQNDAANEAFLLNGTLSRNLQQVPGDFNDTGQGRWPGQNGSGPGTDGGGSVSAPGFDSSGGGPGGGFGGPGGGGFGGGGRGGFGPGGFGGRRGPGGGGFQGRRGFDNGVMGNRRNRGQQGLHGMVNVVLHNSIFDARPFSLNGQEVPKPSYAQERFSFQIGGPLMFPKLFKLQNTTFNLNYTINRADNLVSQFGTVPTDAERTGDFAGLNQIIYNPITHGPYPGNIIPTSQISPIALGLLSYFPQPNQTGSCSAALSNNCIAQNYQFSKTVPNNNQNVGLRLGQSIGQHDRLALNFQFQDRSGLSPQIFGFLDDTSGQGISTVLSWTHTFASRMFSIASVNFNRNRTDLLPFFANGTDVASEFGILGTSTNPLNYGPPNLNFTNFSGLSDGSPSSVRVQSITPSEAFTIMHGNHRIGFGAMYQRAENNTLTDANGRGTFTFTGLATSAFNANGQPIQGTGNDFADFLLGLPNSSSIRYGDTSTYFRANNYSFYGLDDWRIRSNLTFNFGLRYEFFGVPHEIYGHEANLDVAPGFTAVVPVVPGQNGPYSGVFPAGLVNPDFKNFAPRIGVAWKPRNEGSTVIRAGYGIYYNGGVYNAFMRNLSAQPPFAITNTELTSLAAPLTLTDGFIVTTPGKTILNSWAINRFYLVPYAQTWNASIQRDLPGRLVLQVGYLGTKGTHLDTLRIPNRAAAGSSPLNSETNRQIANATAFTYESSDANSIYNALRVTLFRRFSRGISFNADYVFSKAIDDASTFGGGVAQNDLDIAAERSLSNFDRRHVFNARWVLTSPFGHDSRLFTGHDRINRFLEDWTLSGGLTAETGLPLNPLVAGNLSNSGGTGVLGTLRPDAMDLPVEGGTGFFNPLAFVLPPAGQFGNAGRNTIPGPGLVSLNASFGRPFTLGERRVLEFRFDATNALNQVNITSLGTTINAANYGLPLAASAMRSISVTLRFRF